VERTTSWAPICNDLNLCTRVSLQLYVYLTEYRRVHRNAQTQIKTGKEKQDLDERGSIDLYY
jgi:hypothetical protein